MAEPSKTLLPYTCEHCGKTLDVPANLEPPADWSIIDIGDDVLTFCGDRTCRQRALANRPASELTLHDHVGQLLARLEKTPYVAGLNVADLCEAAMDLLDAFPSRRQYWARVAKYALEKLGND